MRSDGLSCFRGVLAAGCEHQPRVTGGSKGSCETPGMSWLNTLLGNVKRAIDGTYHACSSRYAGRYLAEFASTASTGAISWSISYHVSPTSLCALLRCPIGSQLWLELLGNQELLKMSQTQAILDALPDIQDA